MRRGGCDGAARRKTCTREGVAGVKPTERTCEDRGGRAAKDRLSDFVSGNGREESGTFPSRLLVPRDRPVQSLLEPACGRRAELLLRTGGVEAAARLAVGFREVATIFPRYPVMSQTIAIRSLIGPLAGAMFTGAGSSYRSAARAIPSAASST